MRFRPLDLEADLALVHAWMQEPHVVPWWELAGSPAAVRTYLAELAAQAHVDQWIVSDDERRPFAYVETYSVFDDVLAAQYDAQPGDRGFHLLVGPPDRVGRGLGLELVRTVVARLLADPAATRVVCEPDVRNARMLACCRGLGAAELGHLAQPGRSAILLCWTRESGAVAA